MTNPRLFKKPDIIKKQNSEQCEVKILYSDLNIWLIRVHGGCPKRVKFYPIGI